MRMAKTETEHHFILIHGAFHGSWCWELVVPKLEALGHRVSAVDLPGPGNAAKPVGEITLADYVACVRAVVEDSDRRPVLVGHSLGGVTVSATAEALPEKLGALVYLTAALIPDGQSAFGVLSDDPESLSKQYLLLDEDAGVMRIRPEGAAPSYYSACSPEQQQAAIARLREQPLKPLLEPVSTSRQRFGQLAMYRHFIECTEDRALTLALQRRMYNNVACPHQFTLRTDHSPFYSAPDELVDCLKQVVVAN
jgi:pimeloyl-ACP methyl ester carboxylesterase